MSAAAKPWKSQDEKDRRSNMVLSSINAPAKKDGGGGSFTWGKAGDITDYEPVGLNGMTKVVTAAAPMQVRSVQLTSQTAPTVTDTKQFPGLGPQPAPQVTSQRWSAAPQVLKTAAMAQAVVTQVGVTQAAPPVMRTVTTASVPPSTVTTTVGSPISSMAPRVMLGEDMLRAGVPSLNATHPRNTFARKPHHKPFASGTAPAELQEAPSIDWTASGTTAFQQQVIHAVAQNPAHLGPYMEAKPGPTLAQLQVRQAQPVNFIPNPKLSKQVMAGPKVGKPQVIFQRKC